MPKKNKSKSKINEDNEIRKIFLEEEKLKFEKTKLFATFFSLLLTLITIILGVWSINRQADLDFEIKSAEIIMDSNTASGSYNRARVLLELFPHRLSSEFAEKFNPSNEDVFNPELYQNPSYDARMNVLRLILEYPDQIDKIINNYQTLFPDSSWVEALK